MSKAYVLMSHSGGSWGPVAVFSNGPEAERAAAILNTRLFGDRRGSRDKYSGDSFTVEEVAYSPKIQDTGKQRYCNIDPDDPGWSCPVDSDMWGDSPDDMYDYATMFEQDNMDAEIALLEPEAIHGDS